MDICKSNIWIICKHYIKIVCKYNRIDDAHLLKFLRGCKFSLERSKEKLDLYNACRSNVPQWFGNWDVESPLFQKFLGWG